MSNIFDVIVDLLKTL